MTIQRIDSHIEERARLVFVFPGPTDEKRILPFFENVTIKESKQAKLAKYSPIGRSSNSFGYVGANSRKLSLSFNMTLPNIQIMATAGLGSNLGMRRRDNSVETLQNEFFKTNTGSDRSPVASQFGSVKYEQRWRDALGEDFSPGSDRSSTEEAELLRFREIEGSPLLGQDELKYRTIDTIVYWSNLIRSSVLNNATNPFYGPPVVRLTYGVLYQNIPCVCESYRISADDKAGYDQRTLLPRVIGVSMELHEVREGDRGAFQPVKPISRDNLAGWESIIGEYQTTDPMSTDREAQEGSPQLARDTDNPEGRVR